MPIIGDVSVCLKALVTFGRFFYKRCVEGVCVLGVGCSIFLSGTTTIDERVDRGRGYGDKGAGDGGRGGGGRGDGGRGGGGRQILGAGVIPKFVVFYRFLCTSVQ